MEANYGSVRTGESDMRFGVKCALASVWLVLGFTFEFFLIGAMVNSRCTAYFSYEEIGVFRLALCGISFVSVLPLAILGLTDLSRWKK